jgi:hypothetical protein
MFLRDRDDVDRTYTTILDLSIYGGQQGWEDSPPGWPQHPTCG